MSNKSEEPEDASFSFEDIIGSASMSPLDQQSNEMHEVFLSLRRVGFSERQALVIVSMALVSFDDEETDVVFSHPSSHELDLQFMTDDSFDDDDDEDDDDDDDDDDDKVSL